MTEKPIKSSGELVHNPHFMVYRGPASPQRPANSVVLVIDNRARDSDVKFIGRGMRDTLPNTQLEDINVLETGDNFPRKICNVCYVLKPTTKFSLNQHNIKNRNVRRPTCIECRRGIDGRKPTSKQKKAWEERHGKPEKGDFFKCPICEKSYIIYRVGSDITLDHDHRTGEPRGYICGSCNTGLGRFRNGSIFIYRAAAYLRQHYEDAD